MKLSRGLLWHTDPDTCPHFNDHVCPTCDFDDYYAATYIDCPWRVQTDDLLIDGGVA